MRLIDADALIDDIQKHTSSYVGDFVKKLVDKQETAQSERFNPCTVCQEFDCSWCKFRRT